MRLFDAFKTRGRTHYPAADGDHPPSRRSEDGHMAAPIEELRQSRDRLFSRFTEGEILETFLEEYTELLDQYFRRSLQDSKTGHRLFATKRPFALIALGSYGRKELCCHSDIDVMVLFKDKIPSTASALAEELLYPLWDLGFELGYAIRDIRDCLTLSNTDFMVFTSLLDARFIGGESPLYLNLLGNITEKVITKKSVTFRKWIEQSTSGRMDAFGDASYLLEPHLKEGIGGLRDYHNMLWLARVFFDAAVPRDLEVMGALSHAEYEDLRKNLRLIWLARCHLHLLSGRENDRLLFEYQGRIALRLGYRDRPDFLAVEHFLGELHASMASVKSLQRSFLSSHPPKTERARKPEPEMKSVAPGLRLINNEIDFIKSTDILSRPVLLLEIFEKSAKLGFPLSLESKRLVREFAHLIDDGFRASKDTVQMFLDIINFPQAFDILDQMFECGLLEAFLPEFRDIKNRIQFDAYHIFPVGRHALQTVRFLKGLSEEKDLLLLDILHDIADPEPLFLAALFHDIGKKGKNHAVRGVGITAQILKRFGYDRELQKEVLFLVRYHLLLVETATRRDLNDEKAVIQNARVIGNVTRLKMLYLLTWADSRATGPKAWNEWIANLVQELFFKVLHVLEKGEMATPRAKKKVNKTLSQVRRLLAGKMEPSDLDSLLESMSPRYLLETPARNICHHLDILVGMEKIPEDPTSTPVHMETKKKTAEESWEVTVLGKDRPGLFSDIAGTLALNNINILSAHIYTWRNGTIVDVFRVTDPLDPIDAERIWEKTRRDLKDVFAGRLILSQRLEQKSQPSILKRKKAVSRPPKVRIDNVSSDFFTLIEVFADDYVGLLYDITRSLFLNDVNIVIAKIATKVDQVVDIFYIQDLEGQKVLGEDHLEKIKEALLSAVGPRPPHGG
ncbi:MAG: [protein-PII] uridylyltransferase [Desulfatiglandales bacterium]